MIIGLCGFAQTGKTTVADYLNENYKFRKINFKDGLIKEMRERLPDVLNNLAEIYDTDIDRLFKEKPPAMRALMQNYGTNVRRGDDNNYWVEKWLTSARNTVGNIVTDDVRFTNEWEAIKNRGGILIRVERADIQSAGTHQSETEHLSFKEDFTIQAVAGEHHSVYAQLEAIIKIIKSNND